MILLNENQFVNPDYVCSIRIHPLVNDPGRVNLIFDLANGRAVDSMFEDYHQAYSFVVENFGSKKNV